MDKKTLKEWSVSSGINPRSAGFARERVGVGEKIGGYWFLTGKEFEAIKKSMTGKGKYDRSSKSN